MSGRIPAFALTLLAVVGPLVLGLPAPAMADTKTVIVNGSSLRFEPQDAYILQGDTVLWEYQDSNGKSQHTVSRSASPESFESSTNCPGTLLGNDCIGPSRQSFSHTFQTVGSFTYVCRIHASSGMIATIHVRAPQPTQSATATSTPTAQHTQTQTPSASASPTDSLTDTQLAAPTDSSSGPDSDSKGGGVGRTVAIAIAGVLGLGAAGYFVWARFVSRR